MKLRSASLFIRAAGLVILFALLYVALFPHRASACDTFDVACPVDVGFYSVIVSISEGLWAWNRAMLYIARLVEGLRVWLISDVLGTALDATIAGVKFPFWIVVGIAWIVFVVSFLLQAVVRLDWVDLRKGIRNAILAVILFQVGSQAMAGMEQMRVTVGQGFQSIASTTIGDATTHLGFYVGSPTSRGDSIEAPHSIYDGADTCPGVDLKRDNPQSMFMSDYLANFLYADAHDIHCPNGSGAALPDNYIKTFEIRDISNEDADTRARLTILARLGMSRQAQAILPTVGAVLEQVMHLVFALALASLWFGLVISMLFSLFLPTEGIFKGQIDGMLATLKASWLASFWVGIGMSLVAMASDTGNALAVNGITIGMFVVFVYQIRGAIQTLRGAVVSTSTTLGQAPAAIGGMARGFSRLSTDGAIIGAAMATGNSGELVEAGLQQMRRKLAFSTSGNLLAQAGERLLLNKAMGPVERWVQDEKDGRAIGQREDESSWYEQRLKDPRLTGEQKSRALRRTDEIDKEIETRTESTTKRTIQQARSSGAWGRADKLQKQADEQEVSRLEAKLDEAQRSGDPKLLASIPKIQERIDFLRGVPSAAVDTANGTVGAAVGASGNRLLPLPIGLQEVDITHATSGQLSVNGHTITSNQVSTNGHHVTLSAGDRMVDISRDDAIAANGLEAGKALTIQANVRDPNGDSAPAPRADGDVEVRAQLELSIQEGQRQERVLMDQRDVAFDEHRFSDARKLGEQINGLRTQMTTDRSALTSVDRAGAGVRVASPALSAGVRGSLPSFTPGAIPLSSNAENHEREVRARQLYVEQSVQRLEDLQQQQAQLVAAGQPAQAALLDPQIAERQTFVRRNQEIYNQIAAAPPAGGVPAPQIVVGAPGFVPVSGPNTPVIVQAPPADGAAVSLAQSTATPTAQPVSTQPVMIQPTAAPAAQPVSAQPMLGQPVAQPAGMQSVMIQPTDAPAAQPMSAQPKLAQPLAQPVSTQPVMIQPSTAPVAQPMSAQPMLAQPVAQPAGTQPVMIQPTAAPVAQPASPQAMMVQPTAAPVAQPASPQAVMVQPTAAPMPTAVSATPILIPAPPSAPAVISQPTAPPTATSVQRPTPLATGPAPLHAPSRSEEPRQASSSAASGKPAAASTKPRLWKNRDRHRNGPRGGSGGTL